MNKKIIFTALLLLIVLINQNLFAKSALLVIDMQKKLLTPGKWEHVDSSKIDLLINTVNENIKIASTYNIPIIYVVLEITNPIINFFSKDVCKKGTEGAKLDNRVICDSTLVFIKCKPSALSNLELKKYLIQNSINTLFITGNMAEGCISATVIDALKEKFVVILIEKGIGSKSNSLHNNNLKKLEKAGAITANTIKQESAQ